MYFPYLRGRQFELIALRELLESERIGQEIIPIIEPVKPSATLLKTLECFVNHDREIAVVFNPAVGDFPKKINEMRRENSKIANELYELLTKHNKIIKSYIMSAKSAVKLKTDELKTERLIINPDRDCLDDFLEVYDKSLPRYTLIPDDRAFRRVISESKVLFEDNFNKRSRNIDYIEHEDEFFSDSHLYFQNENYVGFADYYLSDGDVMRAQFTLKYGGDIGGSGGMGGGYDDSYSVANKDVLTTTLAKINSAPNSAELKADPDIAAKITEAKEVLQNIVAEQSEVDKVNDELNKLLGGEITSITLDQSEITLENEGTMQLNAKVELTGKPIEPIEWNSEEPSVATVKNGLVTAVGAGTTTITATCGEKTATCKVTVNASPLQEVRLDKSKMEILKNDSETLTATLVPANTTDDRTVTWSTNAEDVATVNQSGRVTGKKEGTAVITAKVGDKEADCTVTVKEVHTQRIYFDDSKLTLNKGKNKTLSLRFDPSNTTDAKKATW